MNKVFCIGAGRTGTTSMNKCLKQLNLTPISSGNGEMVSAWLDGNIDVIFDYCKRYKSFEDNPWCFGDLYKKLDKRFPNSKFILTIREPNAWYNSFVRFLTPPGKSITDITYKGGERNLRAHKEIWGVTGNSMEGFKESYINQFTLRNQEIQEYFKGRENDLLVIDITNGSNDRWDKICNFLHMPIQKNEFPHAHRS